jgi:DNA-binding transcriptional regulator LsrR (DeoR family)
VAVLRAALRLGVVNVLVTDEKAAEGVLSEP